MPINKHARFPVNSTTCSCNQYVLNLLNNPHRQHKRGVHKYKSMYFTKDFYVHLREKKSIHWGNDKKWPTDITTAKIVKKRMFAQKQWLNVGCVRTAAGIWRMCRAFASRAFPTFLSLKQFQVRKFHSCRVMWLGIFHGVARWKKISKLTILFKVSHFLL